MLPCQYRSITDNRSSQKTVPPKKPSQSQISVPRDSKPAEHKVLENLEQDQRIITETEVKKICSIFSIFIRYPRGSTPATRAGREKERLEQDQRVIFRWNEDIECVRDLKPVRCSKPRIGLTHNYRDRSKNICSTFSIFIRQLRDSTPAKGVGGFPDLDQCRFSTERITVYCYCFYGV